MNRYGIHAQENDARDAVEQVFSPDTQVRGEIGPRTFTGRVLEAGYDGEPVVYVEDRAGHERAIRLRRESHDVQSTEEGSV